ncbi:alpha-galactosidase [Lacticaseibacillus mingshuiensis]|uniref:alpha-galactosidase n=1 Tax=Lacticaseibacillus mingshuiensis TaxID=2799574 RepID=UPI00194F4329|nr:alpha-galactosidase [Lacticaseibacillus mingshuiensis]
MPADPDKILLELEDGTWHDLVHDHIESWRLPDSETAVTITADGTITLFSPHLLVARVRVDFPRAPRAEALFFGDAFERSYGDLQVHRFDDGQVYDWYLIEQNAAGQEAIGVAIQPNAFCAWTVKETTRTLWLDVRSGTEPVALGARALRCCRLVTHAYPAAQRLTAVLADFCARLAGRATPPVREAPLVGTNDWYFAYGANSRQLIVENARAMAALCQPFGYRPWVLIDDGWQVQHAADYNGGPWTGGNEKFGDMAEVAQELRDLGTRPGLWFRPLVTRESALAPFALHQEEATLTLDPSRPEVLAQVAADVRRFVSWGFELIKFDFSAFDVLGRWGNATGLDYFDRPCHFADRTHTTAEVFSQLYRTIKDAAGPALVMGCNTASHLSAGLLDVMRIGDDTSGVSFHRTVNRGVNTLAFRLAQEGSFYRIDADCVGITDAIPWAQNCEWLRLLAASNTTLFVSADLPGLPASQKQALQVAIGEALRNETQAVPADLRAGRTPQDWRTADGEALSFEWDVDLSESL